MIRNDLYELLYGANLLFHAEGAEEQKAQRDCLHNHYILILQAWYNTGTVLNKFSKNKCPTIL